jgi:hypothetical protein
MQEKITLCCATQNHINKVKQLATKTLDYVDEMVFVDGFSVDGTKDWLESLSPKIKVVQRKWDDSFARQYNRFVQEITEGWLLILDDDEIPSEGMLKSLRDIVDKSDGGRIYDCIEFKCHPIEIDKDGKIVNDNGPVNYYRQILHRYNPGMRYIIDLHQNLVGHKYRRFQRFEHTYYHIKTDEDGYRNACRNWWIDGVWLTGSSSGFRPPEWQELRDVVQKAYPEVSVFSDFNTIMVAGNMKEDVIDHLYKIRNIPDEQPDRLFNELRSYWKYYFDKLHPEEKRPE